MHSRTCSGQAPKQGRLLTASLCSLDFFACPLYLLSAGYSNPSCWPQVTKYSPYILQLHPCDRGADPTSVPAPSKQGLINSIRGLPRALQLLLTIRLVIILSRSPCWFLNPNWQETPVSQWESWGRVSGWQQAPENSWVVGWMCASDLASNPYARFREFL